MDPNRTVVGVDGGSASDSALAWAAHWIDRTAGPLVLIAVVDARWQSVVTPTIAAAMVTALESALERAKALSGTASAQTSLVFGGIVQQLVDESRDARLLVIGTNKTSALSGLIHGTIPLKVADQVRAPLVVVPADWSAIAGPVMLCVDVDTQQAVVDFAAASAAALGTDLLLFHAWNTAPLVLADTEQYAELTHELEATATALVDGIAASVQARHPKLAITKRLEFSEPSPAVIGAARAAQLVVVGSHRRGAASGLLLGSVGHDLLMNMPTVVAIVPPVDAPPPTAVSKGRP